MLQNFFTGKNYEFLPQAKLVLVYYNRLEKLVGDEHSSSLKKLITDKNVL